jgi:hypothetical protein
VQLLNQFVQPNFDLKKNKGFIILTTHNSKADAINAQSLKDLDLEDSDFIDEIEFENAWNNNKEDGNIY